MFIIGRTTFEFYLPGELNFSSGQVTFLTWQDTLALRIHAELHKNPEGKNILQLHTGPYPLCQMRVWEASQAAAQWAVMDSKKPYLAFSSVEGHRGRDWARVRGVWHHYNISQCLPAEESSSSSGREWAGYQKVKCSLCCRATSNCMWFCLSCGLTLFPLI